MNWNDDYLLGFSEMDETHEEFVARVTAIPTAPNDELASRLDALAAPLDRHFSPGGRLDGRDWISTAPVPHG